MLIRLKRNWIPYICFRFDSKIIIYIKRVRETCRLPCIHFKQLKKSNDIYKSKDSLTIKEILFLNFYLLKMI